jgi:hypothetical protein
MMPVTIGRGVREAMPALIESYVDIVLELDEVTV